MACRDFVTIILLPCQWTVRVVESGVMTEREFPIESYAIAWAHGQRIRLNLPQATGGYFYSMSTSGLNFDETAPPQTKGSQA
ncbi:hypothetical protein [Agrobacterium pusense]|jgi:hypothetical protein|uniref:hypothetical protein n=1 Tax=Agrobacterium pusense TaxID=648995 RepID=UPI0021D35E15|nr:hypothetical protein [Agrobacterium pusense]UXT92722.1 hypothetical protein FY130_24025 [Agrobacterium pusense]